MMFNKNVKVDDMKEKISAKIARRCGKSMPRLFYKFLVLPNPCKYTEIKLVNDENMETMIALYCSTRNMVTELVELFTELADVELIQNVTSLNQQYGIQDPCEDLDLDEVPNDINGNDANDDENVYAPSVRNPTRGIVIHNEPRTHMLSVDLDATHASEFLEYPNIIPSYWLAIDSKIAMEELYGYWDASYDKLQWWLVVISNRLVAVIKHFGVPWRFIYCIHHIEVNFHKDFNNVDWRNQVVNRGYKLEQHRFKQRLARLQIDMHTMFYKLETLMPRMSLKQVKQMETGHVYYEEVRKTMDVNAQRVRSMSKRCSIYLILEICLNHLSIDNKDFRLPDPWTMPKTATVSETRLYLVYCALSPDKSHGTTLLILSSSKCMNGQLANQLIEASTSSEHYYYLRPA
ncbi:hypothetical protein GOBAR_DD10176 [Gossypium barbadense]|nr:hypothetical protein GOBAR_DD10176 [Gossypium barbadense]